MTALWAATTPLTVHCTSSDLEVIDAVAERLCSSLAMVFPGLTSELSREAALLLLLRFAGLSMIPGVGGQAMSGANHGRMDTRFSAVDAPPMSDADRYPPCPDCESLEAAPEGEGEHYEGFLYFREPKEFDRFEITATEHKHQMSVDDVLAEYSLPMKITCSMQNHPHKDGFVVRARCGRVLRMGKDCGRQLIHRFAMVERAAKRAREYQAFLPAVTERLRKLRAALSDALALGKRLFAFREFLGEEAGPLCQELQHKYRERNEVRDAERIPGIELWNWDRAPLDRQLSELRALEHESSGWATGQVGHTEQQKILKRVRAIEERVDGFMEWGRVAAMHTTREGMAVACRIVDSEWKETTVSAFDRIAGRAVPRREQILQRTRERFLVTDSGLEVFDRLVPIAW